MQRLINLKSNDDLKPVLGKSILLHGLLVLLFTIKSFWFPSAKIEYIPSIKVDIVALPDKKQPNAAPKVAAPKAAEPVALKPKVNKKAVNLLKKQAKQRAEQRKKALERIKSLQKIEELTANEKAIPKTKTDTLVKGNRISPGGSIAGLDKLDYDQYIGQLETHARANWALPKWLAGTDLTADVRIFLDNNGYVIKKQLVRSSGDSNFDNTVLQAIDDASPFPEPNDKFVDVVAVDGITFTLKP